MSSSGSSNFSGPNEILFATAASSTGGSYSGRQQQQQQQQQQLDIIEFAISIGANIHSQHPGNGINNYYQDLNKGNTPLIFSATNGNQHIVQTILDMTNNKNVNNNNNNNIINIQNYWKQTALMMACKNGHLNIVRLLLSQADIDITIQDAYNNTALMFAIESQDVNIVRHLLLIHTNNNINNTSTIDIVNCKNSNGLTPLIYAISYHNEDIVQILLDHNADVTTKANVTMHETVLSYACNHRNETIVKKIITKCIEIHYDYIKDEVLVDNHTRQMVYKLSPKWYMKKKRR